MGASGVPGLRNGETKSANETKWELEKLSAALKKRPAVDVSTFPEDKKPAGRICSDPKCAHAGKEQPLENFRQGLKVCKKCVGRRTHESRARNLAAEKIKPNPEAALKQYPEPAPDFKNIPIGEYLDLSFEEYPELLTPRGQLLYILRERYAKTNKKEATS